MNHLNQIMRKESNTSSRIIRDFKLDLKANRITLRKKSYDEMQRIHYKPGKCAIFIGICGGQASGKKKISQYFNSYISHSETICEMSFFNPGDKERKFSKEEEYLVKDYDFYSKERRLYLIDLCNPNSYDYDKFYETLKNLNEGKKVKIPYFDENECKFNHEKDKIIDPTETPLIIIDGYFIYKNKKIRDFLDLKIYKEVEDDVRLSRLIIREEKYLKNNYDAYEIYFGIYERFYKTSYEEYISTYKKNANIFLPDYNVKENDQVEGDESLEFLTYNLNNLSKRNKF